MVVGLFVVCNADRNTPQTFYLSEKCQIHCSKWGIGIYKGLVGCLFWPFAKCQKVFWRDSAAWILPFCQKMEDVIDMYFWSLSNSDRSGSIDLLHHGFLEVFKSNLKQAHPSFQLQNLMNCSLFADSGQSSANFPTQATNISSRLGINESSFAVICVQMLSLAPSLTEDKIRDTR